MASAALNSPPPRRLSQPRLPSGSHRLSGPRRWSRRLLRLAVVTVVLLTGLLVLAEGVLPAAHALTLPIRVDRNARLTATKVDPTRYPYRVVPGRVSLDAAGFVVGQCTSFVSWWLEAHHVALAVLTIGPGGTGSFLNASTWDQAARAAGFTVGTVPVVGAIAQWHSNEQTASLATNGIRWTFQAGETGHVAVVTAVLPDGEAEWLEYGWHGQPVLHSGRGWAPRYLYVGVAPPGSVR
jgi:surface antigen